MLAELGLGDKPILTVFNKVDRLTEPFVDPQHQRGRDLGDHRPGRRRAEGAIARRLGLSGGRGRTCSIPLARSELVALFRREGFLSGRTTVQTVPGCTVTYPTVS